ncbi:hypothetical protein ACLKA7_009985 [Drosophila subpalustris]
MFNSSACFMLLQAEVWAQWLPLPLTGGHLLMSTLGRLILLGLEMLVRLGPFIIAAIHIPHGGRHWAFCSSVTNVHWDFANLSFAMMCS